MLYLRKPTKQEERWTKLTDLSTPFKITRLDGKQVPKSSNLSNKDLLVMLPKPVLSYLTADHSTLNSEPNFLTSTSTMIL
jgi:hypothetical protein